MPKKLPLFRDACDAYRRRLHQDGRLGLDTERRVAQFERKFGDVKLGEITNEMVQLYITEKFAKCAPSTINRNISILKAIVGVAVEDGLCKDRLNVKMRRVSAARSVHLEMHEIMPVVNAIREIEGPLAGFFALLLIDTGMRFGEAMRLVWGDLQRDWITVRPTGHGKTKGRKIPTSPRLLQYMSEYNILPYEGDGPMTPVIVSRWNERMSCIARIMNRVLRRACIEQGAMCGGWIRVHDLRHTFAFICASAGADLGDIKELLGHSTIHMTMRYRGFVQVRAADAIRRGMAASDAKFNHEIR